MNFKNNKKADVLMDETGKTILSVVSLILLFFLGWMLYSVFVKSPEGFDQAKASLNNLGFEIGKIEKGEETSAEFFLESPKDWWVITWPRDDLDKKPEICKTDYCICICPENDVEVCSNEGVCKDVSKKIKTFSEEPILINKPFSLNISLEKSMDEIIVKKIK